MSDPQEKSLSIDLDGPWSNAAAAHHIRDLKRAIAEESRRLDEAKAKIEERMKERRRLDRVSSKLFWKYLKSRGGS